MPFGLFRRCPKRPRVVHYMETCFARTETFVYDIVRGCTTFEPWCLAPRIANQDQFPVDRVYRTAVRWDRSTLRDLLDRVYVRFMRNPNFRLHRALRRIRPSVIHAHFGPAGWEILPAARRFAIPLVTSFYGYDASSLPRNPVWAERLRELFAGGAAFLVEGPAMADRLERIGCPRSKITLMPITIRADSYSYRARGLDENEPLRMLFVGRFVPKKGLQVLLRALRLARPRLGPCELRIIGGGEKDAELRKLAADHGIQDLVTFLGFQPRAEMIREMGSAHLLVVPSVTALDGDTEGGAPTVLLEAQACGLPVLGTTHADIPFVVAPPYRGYLADEGSPESLAESLIRIRSDVRLWRNHAAAGLQHVLVQHGAGNFRRLENLYTSLRREVGPGLQMKQAHTASEPLQMIHGRSPAEASAPGCSIWTASAVPRRYP